MYTWRGVSCRLTIHHHSQGGKGYASYVKGGSVVNLAEGDQFGFLLGGSMQVIGIILALCVLFGSTPTPPNPDLPYLQQINATTLQVSKSNLRPSGSLLCLSFFSTCLLIINARPCSSSPPIRKVGLYLPSLFLTTDPSAFIPLRQTLQVVENLQNDIQGVSQQISNLLQMITAEIQAVACLTSQNALSNNLDQLSEAWINYAGFTPAG